MAPRSLVSFGGSHRAQIGAGTGKNIPFYPPNAQVTATDIAVRMLRARSTSRSSARGSPEARAGRCATPSVRRRELRCGRGNVRVLLRPDPLLVCVRSLACFVPAVSFCSSNMSSSSRPLLRNLMRRLDPIPFRIWGAHINRETVSTVDSAGFDSSALRIFPSMWCDASKQSPQVDGKRGHRPFFPFPVTNPRLPARSLRANRPQRRRWWMSGSRRRGPGIRRFVVESTVDFLDKARRTIEFIRREMPPCCRRHLIPLVDGEAPLERLRRSARLVKSSLSRILDSGLICAWTSSRSWLLAFGSRVRSAQRSERGLRRRCSGMQLDGGRVVADGRRDDAPAGDGGDAIGDAQPDDCTRGPERAPLQLRRP